MRVDGVIPTTDGVVVGGGGDKAQKNVKVVVT